MYIKQFIFLALYLYTSIYILALSNPDQPDFVKISNDVYQLNDIEINLLDKTLSLPAEVNMSEGLIEVVLCRPEGKTHESLLVTHVTPLHFNTALLLLGLDPVNEIPEDENKIDHLSNFITIETPGDSVLIFVETMVEGEWQRKPVEHYIYDMRSNSPMTPGTWLFRGPVTHRTGYVIIDSELTMIATYHDPIALMELNEEGKYNDEYFYVSKEAGLEIGQEVKLIIQAL